VVATLARGFRGRLATRLKALHHRVFQQAGPRVILDFCGLVCESRTLLTLRVNQAHVLRGGSLPSPVASQEELCLWIIPRICGEVSDASAWEGSCFNLFPAVFDPAHGDVSFSTLVFEALISDFFIDDVIRFDVIDESNEKDVSNTGA